MHKQKHKDLAQKLVNKIFEAGQAKGHDDVKSGDLVRTILKQRWGHETVRKMMPKSSKHLDRITFTKQTKNASSSIATLLQENNELKEQLKKAMGEIKRLKEGQQVLSLT